MSYVYHIDVKGDDHKEIFGVGYYKLNGCFTLESVWDSREEAMAQVSYLNGGAHPQRNLEYGL